LKSPKGEREGADRETKQMIPSDIKFDGNATPPQFTDNADQVIERGTHIRVKIKGIRGEVGQMYAIATIKEDFLGYVHFCFWLSCRRHLLTVVLVPSSRLESCCYKRVHQPATKIHEPTKTKQFAYARRRGKSIQDSESLLLRSRHRRDVPKPNFAKPFFRHPVSKTDWETRHK
jgi:hypothetical protein